MTYDLFKLQTLNFFFFLKINFNKIETHVALWQKHAEIMSFASTVNTFNAFQHHQPR